MTDDASYDGCYHDINCIVVVVAQSTAKLRGRKKGYILYVGRSTLT